MPKRRDLTGQIFGHLTVLSYDGTVGSHTKWLCKCDCGKTKSILGSNLVSGHTQSCGCCWKTGRSPKQVPVGTRFGHLTVLKSLGVRPIIYLDGFITTRQFLLCKCDCGTLKEVSLSSLMRGVKTCGCGRRSKKND